MEDEKTKKRNYLQIIMLTFFIVFMILYISKEAGYYEYKAHQKVVLTEEAITRFEKDIADGKNVKASDYVKNGYIDYSNKFTVFGSKLGEVIEDFMNDKLRKGIRILGRLFWE